MKLLLKLSALRVFSAIDIMYSIYTHLPYKLNMKYFILQPCVESKQAQLLGK